MFNFSSEFGIRAIDFVQLCAGFILTMLCFFAARDKKHLNMFLLLLFTVQCGFLIVFHEGLLVKLFAALLLLSTLIIEFAMPKKRNLTSPNH